MHCLLNRCVQKGECDGDLISNIVEEDGQCSSESETCCKEEDIKQVRFFYKVDSLTWLRFRVVNQAKAKIIVKYCYSKETVEQWSMYIL